MAGRIRIPPYKPLGINAQGVPGGGYFDIDASAGQFGASPLLQLGLQAVQGAAGIAGAVSPYLGSDNEAAVKAADTKLGETEQALLFDPQTGYLNLQGQAALQQAPAVLDAYTEAQARTLDTAADDDQRRMLQELSDKRLARFNEVVARHSAAQRQSWYDQVGDQRIATMNADATLHWNSDALLRRVLGTARAEVRERAERKGWDSPLTDAALRRETSRVLVSAIGAAVDRDPERARALRTRYAAVIEDTDRAALDALLAEAQTRKRAHAASTEILNATPPEWHHPTPQWRLQQADAITDPAVRAATIRRLASAAAAAETRARTLGEQVLARVLKDGVTDPSQIPISEWVALDAARRQAIETRLDHNAARTGPAPNPALVDQLATQMTEAPHDFARRDLVPEIVHLPLPQWQRFLDWQAGLRRNDPATVDQIYAVKRGLQLAAVLPPAVAAGDEATNIRAGLVEDIDTQRRITGKSPDDTAIQDMVERSLPSTSIHSIRFPFDPPLNSSIHPAGLPLPKGGERRAIELFELLWLLLRGITIVLKEDQHTRPPSSDYRPTPPPPDDGWPSVKRTPAPDMPEVRRRSEPSAPRDMLPPDFQDELKKPETFPQARPEPPPEGYTPVPPPPPLPGYVPEELPRWREGYAPPDFKPPTIYQSGEGSGRQKMVPKPKLSGKERADDVPSFAQGEPRYVDQTPDEYAEKIMRDNYGKNWREKNLAKRQAEYKKIKKFGTRNFMLPKSKQ